MHVYVCEINILVDLKYFDCYEQKMQGNKKKTATQEKHPGRVAQGHKLAALMKKKKRIDIA